MRVNEPSRKPSDGHRGDHPHSRRENLACDTQGVDVVGLIPAHAGKTSGSRCSTAASRAHPRSRGENGKWSGDTKAWLGSSPLTRGKRSRCRSQEIVPGLIPAYAGKTSRSAGSFWWPGAHPRSRGENAARGTIRALPPGSSPLTRGKRHDCDRLTRITRIIPAHAGKTMRGSRPSRGCRDHPRSRGENLTHVQRYADNLGSSPLTRGKHDLVNRADHARRLIPTYAGKTPSRPSPRT